MSATGVSAPTTGVSQEIPLPKQGSDLEYLLLSFWTLRSGHKFLSVGKTLEKMKSAAKCLAGKTLSDLEPKTIKALISDELKDEQATDLVCYTLKVLYHAPRYTEIG